MWRRVVIALTMACLMPREAIAGQELTGALVATVRDMQGGVLRGAIVRIESEALIGGARSETTNDKGQLRFPALPPGLYVVDVELNGFRAHREQDIRLGAGSSIELTVVLQLAGLAQELVVKGAVSRIETRGSGFETRFGPDDIRTTPTRRFSMFDFVRAAPGMSATTAGVSNNHVSAFGSGVNENAFLIDGTNFTCPCSGEARSEPGVDFIQEVHVQSVGASAEFGNIQGAVFNVITRQGGDRFLYDASYYGQSAALTSQPVERPDGQGLARGYERIKYRDLTTNLGGPVVRDRLWFFGGYQHLRDYDSQPGTDPSLPRTYDQDKVFGKLTWRLSPRLQLIQSFHDEFWVNPEVPTIARPFEATQRRHASVPAITFGHLTHTLSPNTVWSVRVGRFVYTRDDDPSTGRLTIPSRFDQDSQIASGAPDRFGTLTLIRTNSKATMDHYRPSILGADHQARFGVQVERGEHHLSSIIPTGVRFVDRSGQPYQAVSSDPSIAGGVFVTTSGFISDAISIGDGLIINAGLRFDHSRAISQDLPVIDAEGRETDAMINGLGTLFTWNVWSPRLGVTMKLDVEGRTVLRGSYGRFNQGVLTGELAPFHPAEKPITTAHYDSATGGYTANIITIDSQRNRRLDRDIRTPRTDEYSIGVDREIGRVALAVAYVRKDGEQFIGWTDVGGQYSRVTRLADGPAVYDLVNSTDDRLFLLTNPDGYSLNYNGVVLAAETRRSSKWQAFASYTFSRTSGLQVSSGATAAGSQVSTIAGSPFLTFGQDPNSLTNADGRLPNDRPHMLRVMGRAELPRIGVGVAANAQHVSGKPWARAELVRLKQGDTRVLLEPRGSQRLSSQTLLDLRLSKTVRVGRASRIELLLDVLNALDDSAEEGLVTDYVSRRNFGQPTLFIDPRRAMLGVRVEMGR
jgi:hypothetical protein